MQRVSRSWSARRAAVCLLIRSWPWKSLGSLQMAPSASVYCASLPGLIGGSWCLKHSHTQEQIAPNALDMWRVWCWRTHKTRKAPIVTLVAGAKYYARSHKFVSLTHKKLFVFCKTRKFPMGRKRNTEAERTKILYWEHRDGNCTRFCLQYNKRK